MNDKVRVRYAPSPTGFLHIGNARTALFNYLFAKHYNGDFIIRIEDTDRKRHVEQGELSQLENLKWLGIDWDEGPDVGGDYGPYRQSERTDYYDPLIEQLLAEDKAYKCYCTTEELEAEREEQRAQGIMPQYSGKCAHLSAEERAEKEAEGITPSVRAIRGAFFLLRSVTYCLATWKGARAPVTTGPGQARREAILDAASSLFAERGYHGASLRDISRRAGISHPGMLHHFASKDTLLGAVIDRLEDHAQGLLNSVESIQAPRPR